MKFQNSYFSKIKGYCHLKVAVPLSCTSDTQMFINSASTDRLKWNFHHDSLLISQFFWPCKRDKYSSASVRNSRQTRNSGTHPPCRTHSRTQSLELVGYSHFLVHYGRDEALNQRISTAWRCVVAGGPPKVHLNVREVNVRRGNRPSPNDHSPFFKYFRFSTCHKVIPFMPRSALTSPRQALFSRLRGKIQKPLKTDEISQYRSTSAKWKHPNICWNQLLNGKIFLKR